MNKRIKYRRGIKLPPNAKYVGRPTNFGNPFKVGDVYENLAVLILLGFEFTCEELDNDAYKLFIADNKMAVDLYELWFVCFRREEVKKLRGYDLACWCGPDEDCHVDYLLNFLKYTGKSEK